MKNNNLYKESFFDIFKKKKKEKEKVNQETGFTSQMPDSGIVNFEYVLEDFLDSPDFALMIIEDSKNPPSTDEIVNMLPKSDYFYNSLKEFHRQNNLDPNKPFEEQVDPALYKMLEDDIITFANKTSMLSEDDNFKQYVFHKSKELVDLIEDMKNDEKKREMIRPGRPDIIEFVDNMSNDKDYQALKQFVQNK